MAFAADLLPTFTAETLTALERSLHADPNTVHVWAYRLDASESCLQRCRGWLTAEERARADRFMFPRLRTRYTVAHGVLRRLLSRYCDTRPETLQFETTAAGKPALRRGSSDSTNITFNLTHSEERAAVAVSSGLSLGIDLEKLRTNVDALSISANYFFGSEREAIERATPEDRDREFFRYWVAKEAVLKAQGTGLGFPLDRFRVDFLADCSHARIHSLDPAALSPDWTVQMLPCEMGWLGAVAARGVGWELRLERLRK